MKNMTKMVLITFAGITLSQFAAAQPFAPQKVLDDLTTEQIKAIHSLGPISNKNTTSPIYDFKLSKILTPAQADKYESLKNGERFPARTIQYQFNIDRK